MNRIFKTVWNHVRRAYVAVNEKTTGAAQSHTGGSLHQNESTTAFALGVKLFAVTLLASAVSQSAHSEVLLYGWDHYTTVPEGGWSADLNAKNYGNDSTDATMTGYRSYDNLAIGRRNGSHIHGGSVPCSNSTTGKCVAPGPGLTVGSNLTIASGANVRVAGNAWLFNAWFVDRSDADDGDDRDDFGSFGQDIILESNARLTIGSTFKIGNVGRVGNNVDHTNPLYGDMCEVRLSSGAYLHAGDIDGMGKVTIDNATFISGGDLGYRLSNDRHGNYIDKQSQYYVNGYRAVLQTATLNSYADISVTNGGTLYVTDNIAMDSKTVTGTNSTFKAALSTLGTFTTQDRRVSGNYISESANDWSGTSITARALGKEQTFGSLYSAFTNNVSWSNGTFYLTGTYNQSLANSATAALKSAFGSSNSVRFENIQGDPIAYANGLPISVVNSIMSENGRPELILYSLDLDAANQDLTIGKGTGSADIPQSIGFQNLNNFKSLEIDGGKIFVLLGGSSSRDIVSGLVTVTDGRFRVGSSSFTSGGRLNEVALTNKGTFQSAGGRFDIAKLSGEGNLVVSSGTLNVAEMNASGTVENAGTLNFAQDSVSIGGGSNSGALTTNTTSITNDFSNDHGTWNLGGKLAFFEGTTVTNGSGRINTVFGNLFDNGTGAEIDPINTIGVNAVKEEQVATFTEDWFTKYVPGTVKDAVRNHMTFDGNGNVTITDAELTVTQRDDLVKAFKAAFGDKTTVSFLGKIEGTSTNSVLNMAMVNRLADAGHSGITYIDRALEGEDQAVMFGNGGLNESVGFMGITKAQNVTIGDQKKMVLVGKKGDANYEIVETTNPVSITDGGRLQLGSLGLAEADKYQGRIGSVSADGSGVLLAAAGDYAIGTLALGAATAQIDSGAKLAVTTALTGTSASAFTNRGDFTAQDVDFSGNFVNEAGTTAVQGDFAAKNTVTNKSGAVMTIAGNANIAGTFTNEAVSTRAGVPNLRIDGKTTVNGTFNNAGHAVLADATVTDLLTNQQSGHLETDKLVVNGTLANYGLIDAQNSSEVHGTLTNTGTINLWNSTIASGGRLSNTGLTSSITGTGTIQVDGLLSNVDNAQFTGEILSIGGADRGEVQNEAESTIAVETMTVGNGLITNYGDIVVSANPSKRANNADAGKLTVASGSRIFSFGSIHADQIEVEAGGAINIYGKTFDTASTLSTYGANAARAPRAVTPTEKLDLKGEYNNANGLAYVSNAIVRSTGSLTTGEGATTIIGVSDYWANGVGLEVEAGGRVNTLGDTIVSRKLVNAGTIAGSGTLTVSTAGMADDVFTNSGTINVANITFTKKGASDELVLENTGTIKALAGFTADGMTYRQTADGASLTAAGGWFTNSNVTIEAGGITHDGLGTGNTYNLGKAGATTQIVTADLGTLTSDSVVNVLEGATLDARDLQLTSGTKTLHLLGGRMETTLDQLFGDIRYTALDLDATDRDDLVDVEGVKIATGVGTLKTNIAAGAEFGWGTVAFDDSVYSASVAGDVLAKLDANDAPVTGHENDLEVAFNGKSDQYFTVDLANRVTARPAGTQDAFGTAYAVFSNETLTNTTAAKGDGGGKLLIGTNDAYEGNVLKTNIGFAAIQGVGNGVRVENRQLVLTGNAQSDHDVAMLDGDLAVGAQGLATFGSYGTDTARKGAVQGVSVETDGALRMRNGAWTGGAVQNAGLILVGGDGNAYRGVTTKEDAATTFTGASYTSKNGGELLNWGTTTFGDMLASADQPGGSVKNYGTFRVTNTAEIANDVENYSTMTFNTLTQTDGVFTNGLAPVTGEDAPNASNAGVTLSIANHTVGEAAEFINWAALTGETETVSGKWTNEAGGTAAFDLMTVMATGDAVNAGTLTLQGLDQMGGTVKNLAGASTTIAGTTPAQIAGAFTNEGAFELTNTGGLTLLTGADFVNQGAGTFAAQSTVTVEGGRFTQNSSEAAEFGALQIAGVGLVDVRTGRVINSRGELSINTTEKDHTALTNAGTVNFASATITSGKVTGNGTFESERIVIAANGDLEQQKVSADTAANDGRLSVHELALTQQAQNNAAGTIEVHDRLNGNIVNAGTLLFTDGNTADHDPGTLHFASGTVTNTGTLSASEKVSLEGGHLIQNADTAASFTDVAVNSGDFTVNAGKTANLSGALDIALADKAQNAVRNDGTLTFAEANVTSGTVTGTGAFGRTDADIRVAADGTLDQGSIEADTLANAGAVTADNLTVHTDGTNTGTLSAIAAAINKAFTNAAEGVMNLATSFAGGTLTNLGTLNIQGDQTGAGFTAASGTIENSGVLNATEKVTLAGGNIHQSSTTAANFTDLTVEGGRFTADAGTKVNGTGSLVINLADKAASGLVNNGTTVFANAEINSGKVTGTGVFGAHSSTISVAADGAIEQGTILADAFTNAGAASAGTLSVQSGATNTGSLTLADRLEGDLVNNGTTTIAGKNGFSYDEGTLTNQGTLTATEKVTLGGGHIVQASDTAASFTDVAVNSGDLTVNAGKTANLSGRLDIALADKAETALRNDGTLTFAEANVTSGTVTGAGDFGRIDADITVGADGTVDQGSIEADTLANAGFVTADNLTVHTDGTNTGTLSAIAAAFDKAFTNAAEGVMNLATSFAGGTLANLGTFNIAGDQTGAGFTATSGTIENSGTLNATEKVTLAGGNIHQASSTAANFTDLTVNEGLFTADAGTKVNGTGSLVINLADKNASGLVNNGTTVFANAEITSGKVTGTGVFGDHSSAISVAVDGAIEQAKVLADSLTNAGTIKADIEVNGGANSGTIAAGDFTAHGASNFTNTGSLTTTGSAVVSGLVNEGEAHFNQGASFSGTNVTQGTGATAITGGAFSVLDGTTSVLGNGTLTANAGTSVSGTLELNSADASISLTNGATVNKGGVISNAAGSLTIDTAAIAEGGKLASSGTTQVGKVSGDSKGEIVLNGGTMHFDDLTDAEGMTFTQTAGDVGSVTADRGWFEHSTINIAGGKFDASVIKNDNGQADGHLGANIVNIGLGSLYPVVGPDSELPSADKVGWKDPYVVVKVDELLSETTVNVLSGGVLDVEKLNLTPQEGDAPSVTVGKGGGIQTSLEQIFNDVTTSAIDINAVDPETGLVYIKTDVLATNRVGTVKDNIASGLQFENLSMVAFDDPDWSIDLVMSVNNSMKEAGLTSDTVAVQTHYLGDFQGLFTLDTAHKLFAEQSANGTTKPVLDPGVVFDTTTFYNVKDGESADKAPGKLVIAAVESADGANTITGSIGFKEVKNTDEVVIQNGKEFVLVGGDRPADFNWETGYGAGNQLLVDAADGGKVTVQEGTLTLGSWGLSDGTVGWVNSADIGAGSDLVTKNGEFAVWQIANNGGTVSVTDGSILHTHNLTNTAGSKVNVAGGLTVDEAFDNTGSVLEVAKGGSAAINAYTSNADSAFKSDGSITLENAPELNGTYDFGKNSQFTVETNTVLAGSIKNDGKAWYKDLTVSAGSKNTSSGYEQGEDLLVAEGASHVNTGTSIWNTAQIDGSFTNSGTTEGSGFKVGTDAEGDTFVINGTFTNTEGAKVDATLADMTTVAGGLVNAGTAGYNDMTITAGGSSTNSGYEAGNNLVVSGEAVHTNTGTSIWNKVSVESGGLDVFGSDKGDESFEIKGAYENHGTLDASKAENVTIAGSLVSDGTMTWDKATVTGSAVNQGTETGSKLTIADKGQHWTVGTSDFDEVLVEKGGLDQFGTDAGGESYEIGGKYVNNGTVNASKAETINVAGKLTNNGDAFYDDMKVTGTSTNTGYEKGDILTVLAGGAHANTGTSIWNGVSIEAGASGTNGAPIPQGGLLGNQEGFTSSAILQIGTEDGADDRFTVAGNYVNNGIIQAAEAEKTTVSGNLANNGQALYDDMDVAGTSTNAGYEKGDILTVLAGAAHVNTGTSIWNTADVAGTMTNGDPIKNGIYGDSKDFDAEKAAHLQIGSDAKDEAFTVTGSFSNHGVLNASGIEQTNVSGTGKVENDGQALYQDMTIGAEAASQNNGLEKGQDLVVAGSHVNTGISIWNTASIEETGSMTSGEAIPEGGKKGHEEGFTATATTQLGTDDKGEIFDVKGDLVNHGDLDAKKTETTLVAGTGSVANDGRAWYDDMTIELGGTSENSGYEKGDILTVEGVHANTGTSIWNTVSIGKDGSLTNGTALAEGDKKGDEAGFKPTGTTSIGSETENETVTVAGDLVNHGVLDASKAETTEVKGTGTVVNDGQASYDDMTIEKGGNSENSGYEKGDILTVAGNHTNSGTSIWNNVNIDRDGSVVNDKDADQKTGSEAADEKNVIEGEYVNKGNLDSKDTETTEIDGGSSKNEGNAEYDDMTIVNGGKSENSGYEKGDQLTVGKDSTHENTGTSIWNNITIDEGGSAANGKDANQVTGTDAKDEENVIKGDYKNEGTLDSTKTETTIVDGGKSENSGKAEYDDMTITNGGKSDNSGYEKGDILIVDKDSTHENSGESHWNNIVVDGSEVNTGRIDAGKINIGEDGKLDNQGQISTGEFVVEGGVIEIGGGRIDAGKTEVNGGDIIIGNRDELSNENRVDYDTTFDKDVNGGFWVIGNGDLSIGTDAGGYAEKIGAPDIPDVASRITVTETVTVGATGSIAVGSEGWTSETNHKDVGNGDLWFGKDSVTVVDSTILSPNGTGTVFASSTGLGKVTVEPGAQIVLGGLEIAGDYTITTGFATSGNLTEEGSWAGGWTPGSIWAPADAGSGLEWVLTLGWDETKLWVHAVMEDVLNKYPDIVIPGNINDSLENCRGAQGPDQVLACTVIRDKTLSAEEKTRILNSVAQIGTAAGAMNAAMNAANQAADSLEGRLSMTGEGFEKDGTMKTFEKRKALWADALGGWNESDGFKASSDMQIGWDANSYGFIMGADNRFEKRDVILGAAFSYQTGSSDSVGEDFLATKNDFSTFGLHAYAGWKPSARTNVIGTLSFFRSSSEATQSLPIAFRKAEAQIDTNLFALGIRGEAVFEKGVVSIIPHAGLRTVIATGSDYDTKLDGSEAYKNETDTSVTFQAPIGVTLRFDHLMKNGWTLRPTADVTVMPQFGDTEQKTTVKGTSGASDEVTGEFTGSFVATGTVGLQVENQKGFAAGLKFGYSGGQAGQKDMNLKLELRKSF